MAKSPMARVICLIRLYIVYYGYISPKSMRKLYLKLTKKASVVLLVIFQIGLPIFVFARVPNDPGFISQAPFLNKISASEAWDFTTGSKAVVVAVIDTGADTLHEDLSSNIWKNTKEIPGNAIDDDHNGFVDDVSGWNFIENNNDPRTSVFGSKDDAEAVLHGTVIAGLVGAVGNNDRNGTGVNWQVSIMPLRAIGSSGTGSYTNLVKAVHYATNNGADIITMSFTGASNNEQLRNALRQAYDRGIFIVAAAGNHTDAESGDLDQTPVYPACYDSGSVENWILSVGSVDSDDRVSTFSNYGSCVDVFAPGEGIYSIERYAPQYGYTMPFGGEWRGTSFGAPLVAGAAALLKSYRPSLSPAQIMSSLLSATDQVKISNSNQQGKIKYGRINIGRSIKTMAEEIQKAPHGVLYRFNAGQVERIDVATGESSKLLSLPGAQVFDLAANADDIMLAALFKQDKFYYVRFIDSAGKFAGEISLPFVDSPTLKVKRVRFIGLDQVFVEQYDNRRKVTIFSAFTTTGGLVSRFEVAGQVVAWDTGKSSSILTYVKSVIGAVTITEVDIVKSSKRRHTYKIAGVVEDMRLGPLAFDNGEQAVVLVRQGSNMNQYTFSFDTKNPWRLRLVRQSSGNLYSILAYKQDGIFSVKDYRGTITGSVTVPKGTSTVVY